jgi:hypothetical protein
LSYLATHSPCGLTRAAELNICEAWLASSVEVAGVVAALDVDEVVDPDMDVDMDIESDIDPAGLIPIAPAINQVRDWRATSLTASLNIGSLV